MTTNENPNHENIFCFLIAVVFCFPVFSFAQIVITEIMYDLPSPGGDGGREWIEIKNVGSHSYPLNDLRFADKNGKHLIKNDTVSELASGVCAVIADKPDVFGAENSSYSGLVLDSSFGLNNTEDTLSILDISGETDVVLDSIFYSKDYGGAGDGNTLHRNTDRLIASSLSPGNCSEASSVNISSETIDSNQNTGADSMTTSQSLETLNVSASSENTSGFPVEPQIIVNPYGTKNAVIGAGAVVLSDVSPGVFVAGVPARPLKHRHHE